MGKVNRLWDALTLLAFAALLVIPVVLMLTGPFRRLSGVEGRFLATLPDFNGPPNDTLRGLDAYVTDRIGLRETLFSWNRDLDMFGLGISPDPRVMLGTDGWLYIVEDHLLRDFMGLERLTPAQLERWQTAIEERRDLLAARDIPYIFFLAPEKQTIIPDYMPPQYAPGETTMLDQWLAYLRAHSDIDIIDPRALFDSLKDDVPLYIPKDTHWNGIGAYYGYRLLLEHMNGLIPPDDVLPLDALSFSLKPAPRDLPGLMGMPSFGWDYELTPKPWISCVESLPFTGVVAEPVAFRDPYYFRRVANPDASCPQQNLRAVMFVDSFGVALAPPLIQHFEEIVIYVVPSFSVSNFEQVIDAFQPDVVIQEMAERKLPLLP